MMGMMAQTTAQARWTDTAQTLMTWTQARLDARAERQNALAVMPAMPSPDPTALLTLALKSQTALAQDATDAIQGMILAWYGVASLTAPMAAPIKTVSDVAPAMTRWQALGVDAVTFWTGGASQTLPTTPERPAPAKSRTPRPKPALRVVAPESDAQLDLMPAPAADTAAEAPATPEAPVLDALPEETPPVVGAVIAAAVSPAIDAVIDAARDRTEEASPIPLQLSGPRETGASDLKLIKGIGAKMESLLNTLGIYHFDQIAAWTPEQVAWIESKIDFRGRVTRENWVGQAATLLG